MKIHPREVIVRKAENELRELLCTVTDKHGLTEAEKLRVINAIASDWIAGVAKYAIRDERHGVTDKPGGLE